MSSEILKRVYHYQVRKDTVRSVLWHPVCFDKLRRTKIEAPQAEPPSHLPAFRCSLVAFFSTSSMAPYSYPEPNSALIKAYNLEGAPALLIIHCVSYLLPTLAEHPEGGFFVQTEIIDEKVPSPYAGELLLSYEAVPKR